MLAGSEDQDLTLGLLVDRVGEKGFGMLLVLLAMPSAAPVPAAGYSTPFGIMLAILAWQMVRGHAEPVFPKKFRAIKLPRGLTKSMLWFASKVFRVLEVIIRPRMQWIGGRTGRVFMGALVLAMAGLMILPIPNTNTLPAFVIFLIGVGLMEEDGLFGIAACVFGSMALALYVFVVYALIAWGPQIVVEGFDYAKDWIKGLIGIKPEEVAVPEAVFRMWINRW